MGGERALAAACGALLALSVIAAATHAEPRSTAQPTVPGPDLAALGLAEAATTTSSTTTTVAPTTTTAPPPPTTAKPAPPRPRTTASALGVPPLNPPAVPAGLAPYRGMGTWVDVYDWTRTYTGGRPVVGVADVDRMAERGVQTLYIQASKWDSTTDVVDPDLLQPMLDRAKARGIKVVAWYLPTLEDLQRDLQRMVAIAALHNVDSLGVDIEARNVKDVNERNRRLVELSAALRKALPGRTISAIVLPPVVLDVVNTSYWPNFPYQAIAPHYDVWMTMGYWTNRKQSSGYRDAYRYTKENVDRLRAHLGANVPVHPIGGLGAGTTPADVEAYRKAAIDTGSLGGSLYDWRTTAADSWPGMQGFRG
ncbi:MAG TPA: hypothetical protein VM938_00975 [Acidimicrobiales bacterium]|nr:hypothetical protein [Acidimicrobiales bacterium]